MAKKFDKDTIKQTREISKKHNIDLSEYSDNDIQVFLNALDKAINKQKYKIKYQDTVTSYYLDVEFKTEDEAWDYMQENNYIDCFDIEKI